MIWEITFFLACFNVIVTAPRTPQYFPGESSGSNEDQEYLEELYRLDIVRSLNSMPTLAETDVHFENNDIKLLTDDCDLDENCLNQKKTSIKKYRQKMQAIQCIHGLFVLKVLDELQRVEPVPRHQHYLKNMLFLLTLAQWDPYDWQIEVFAFVEGLAASDANVGLYREHYRLNNKSMREKPLALVSRCVQEKYLPCRGQDTIAAIRGLVEGVHSPMESLYRGVELDVPRNLELYTVQNLMLWDLYDRHGCFFSWSMYDYQLNTTHVECQLLEHAMANAQQHAYQNWALDPIGGNKYNALISKCIHLRLVHFVWLHLHIYRHTVKSRPADVHGSSLRQMWNALVPTLKTVLRLDRYQGNIYWSAIRIMMDDLANISIEVLEAREQYTRNYFCRAVEDLGLADASDIDRQLREVEVSEHPEDVYDEIDHNSQTLSLYLITIGCTLLPLDFSFVRMIVSAEGNETFIMH